MLGRALIRVDDVWSDVERESSLGICGDLVFDIEKLALLCH